MTDFLKPMRALLSVSDKTGLVAFAHALAAEGIELVSTGGTAKALAEAGLKVREVSDLTKFPEMMDGRLKTLHPGVHGGILARRSDAGHVASMAEHGIQAIDLVVVNLYPFAETVERGEPAETVIENIDIGGPAMIRSAAKNHEFVAVVTDPKQYAGIVEALKAGGLDHAARRRLAAEAFAHTAFYDSTISNWFNRQLDIALPEKFTLAGTKYQDLVYGENPHQRAAFYVDTSKRTGIARAVQHSGKPLSFNNLNDADAAIELVAEFDGPAIGIIKHANPCGVAEAETLSDAYIRALACDPTSAFGGVIATNSLLDGATAELIVKLFAELVVAPEIDDLAMHILKKKEKLRILTIGEVPRARTHSTVVRSLAGGFLVQDRDLGRIEPSDLKVVTRRAPTHQELNDLLFAFRVCKHVKSNAIVYAKDGATVGIGAGQMSRVDSTRIAAWKASEAGDAAKSAPLTQGSVVASDAFFPFEDGLIAAAEAGASAIIQPGGSIRDAKVIEAADQRDLAMVFTGMRHFRH
jgi:phosphoribosylaminoimidazolecarboxamide formyltransferase/IMP cyclohydrolase